MCINVLEHAVQNFAAIFSVSFFWRNFKEVRGDIVYNRVWIWSHVQQVITPLLLQINWWNLQDT